MLIPQRVHARASIKYPKSSAQFPRWVGALLLLFLLSPITPAWADRADETELLAAWCKQNGGQMDFPILDKTLGYQTRVECLTDSHVIEIAPAPQWAKAVGLSKYYAAMTGRRPGVIVILEDEEEVRFLIRLLVAIQADRSSWGVWVIGPPADEMP